MHQNKRVLIKPKHQKNTKHTKTIFGKKVYQQEKKKKVYIYIYISERTKKIGTQSVLDLRDVAPSGP